MSSGIALAQQVAIIVTVIIIATGLLQSVIQLFQLGVAFAVLLRRPPAQRFGLIWSQNADVAPPIAFLVAAYNEERTIIQSLQSLLAMHYPKIEIGRAHV